MWELFRKESVSMSTCYPTRVGYSLCKHIYGHIYLIFDLFTLLRAGEAVRRAGGNLYGIAVSIMRLQIQFV